MSHWNFRWDLKSILLTLLEQCEVGGVVKQLTQRFIPKNEEYVYLSFFLKEFHWTAREDLHSRRVAFLTRRESCGFLPHACRRQLGRVAIWISTRKWNQFIDTETIDEVYLGIPQTHFTAILKSAVADTCKWQTTSISRRLQPLRKKRGRGGNLSASPVVLIRSE